MSVNTGILVIINHFKKFAEAIPCAHDENDAQPTAKIFLTKLLARHGTPATMQLDNAINFTAEIAQELTKASPGNEVISAPAHPWEYWFGGNTKQDISHLAESLQVS